MSSSGDATGGLAVLALLGGFYAVVRHYADGIMDGRICSRCLRRTFRCSHGRGGPQVDRKPCKPPADPEW